MSTQSFGEPAVQVLEQQDIEEDLPDRTPPRRRKVKRKTWQTIIWFTVLIVITAVVLYPLVWLLFATFKPTSEFGQNPGILPENPTVGNYLTVMEGIAGIPMWKFFWNSLVLATLAVIGTVLSSALAAYAFARVQFKGLGILFAAMIGTLLLPFHVVIIPSTCCSTPST